MKSTSAPGRSTEAAVDPRFVERWSPRAFDERAVPAADLASLFEAARWSPSCFNEQPWLFVYGARPAEGDAGAAGRDASAEDAARTRVFDLLVPGNQTWAKRAPVLGIVFAKRRFAANGKDNRWAGFDSGLASMALILQAQELGLITHFMGGFDAAGAAAALGVDGEEWEPMAAFAVGYHGDPAVLPEDLREREKPSGRKPLAEVARVAGTGADGTGKAS